MPRAKTTDPVPHIQALARSFPALATRPGVSPWQPDALDAWAAEALMHRLFGPRHAAQFVLSVWDRDRRWRCGRFEAVTAVAVWDARDRAAFAAWVNGPWWVEDGRRRRRR